MKKILITILFLLFPTMALAQTYCYWTGTEGTYCRTLPADRNWVRAPDGHKISIDEANLNHHGFYELVVTEPSVGADQAKSVVVWGFSANQITKTWTVRDLTTEEMDSRVASPMPLNTYYLWKALLTTGVLTQQQAATHLPQELIDAYQARDRLENP